MAPYIAKSFATNVLQAIAFILMSSVSARAQAVQTPIFVEVPEPSSLNEGVEPPNYPEWKEFTENLGDQSKEFQELYLESLRHRMGQLEAKGDTYRTDENRLESFRIFSELKSVDDEIHEKALPSLNRNLPADLNRYEQAFKDHGDKVQIIATNMRPDAEGKNWEILRRADLSSGKNVPQAFIRSIGSPTPTLRSERTKDEITFYQAVERQSDGSWRITRAPLSNDLLVQKEAVKLYSKVDAEYKKQEAGQSLIKAGDAYNDRQDYDNAIEKYDAALKLYPNSSLAFEHRAEAYYNNGNYSRAYIDYSQAAVLDGGNANAFMGRAKSMLKQNMGQFSHVLIDCDNAIKLNPNSASAYIIRGNARSTSPIYDNETIADYERALKLDPKNIDALSGRGQIYLNRRDFDKSAKDFNTILTIDPTSISAKKGLSSVAYARAHPPGIAAPRPQRGPPQGRHAPGPGNSQDGSTPTGPGGSYGGPAERCPTPNCMRYGQ